MLSVNNLVGFGRRRSGSGTPALLIDTIDALSNSGSSTTYNFTSDIRAASSDRLVVVSTISSASSRNVSSVKVNGTDLTYGIRDSGGATCAEIWFGMVPTGAGSVTIAVQWNGGQSRCAAVVYVLRCNTETVVKTASFVSTSTGITNISVAENGALFCAAHKGSSGSSITNTWSGSTLDISAVLEALPYSMSHSEEATASTVAVTKASDSNPSHKDWVGLSLGPA